MAGRSARRPHTVRLHAFSSSTRYHACTRSITDLLQELVKPAEDAGFLGPATLAFVLVALGRDALLIAKNGELVALLVKFLQLGQNGRRMPVLPVAGVAGKGVAALRLDQGVVLVGRMDGRNARGEPRTTVLYSCGFCTARRTKSKAAILALALVSP